MSSPLVAWQREQIVKELLLLQNHASNPQCPCEYEGEFCIRKHLLTIEALAQETIPIDSSNAELYWKLAEEAREWRRKEERKICGEQVEDMGDLIVWSREWRKKFEAPICEAISLSREVIEVILSSNDLEKAISEVRKILEEKGTIDESDIEKVAEEYNIPFDRLVREALRGFEVEKIDHTYRLAIGEKLRRTFGVILSPEEASIEGFPEKLERCILHVWHRQPPHCQRLLEEGRLRWDKERGIVYDALTGEKVEGCYNPYAVCRAVLRRKYGLPVGEGE